jgi:isoquinoline 1-oxidoreductase alpha subunit
MAKYSVTINQKQYTVEAESDVPLVWILRDYVGLKGTKFGCGIASCGACTVHLNGTPVRSCQLRISALPTNAQITTIEGIGAKTLHVIQQAWIDIQVPQCGYCQSGQVMSAVALLRKNPNPTDKDIDAAMTGNLCRCGTYDRIRKAIHQAAKSNAQVERNGK